MFYLRNPQAPLGRAGRGAGARWYVTASWQTPVSRTVPTAAALAHGMIAVVMNAGHLAAWRLDVHDDLAGGPRRFFHERPRVRTAPPAPPPAP
ncbi:hypothetical protein GCM10023238_39200 [Streptomyces heliomycini]